MKTGFVENTGFLWVPEPCFLPLTRLRDKRLEFLRLTIDSFVGRLFELLERAPEEVRFLVGLETTRANLDFCGLVGRSIIESASEFGCDSSVALIFIFGLVTVMLFEFASWASCSSLNLDCWARGLSETLWDEL